tara:strand:+ start:148 stop:510 length:363 start_codon:yes stop_codon:yes gene_type:complete
MGKRRFHKNLNIGCWTMKGGDCATTHIKQAYLENVTIHQPNLNSKAVKSVRYEGGYRSVFTWFWSTSYTVESAPGLPSEAKRVRYNPRKDDHFHIEGKRVDTLSKVWLLESGECFAIEEV